MSSSEAWSAWGTLDILVDVFVVVVGDDYWIEVVCRLLIVFGACLLG